MPWGIQYIRDSDKITQLTHIRPIKSKYVFVMLNHSTDHRLCYRKTPTYVEGRRCYLKQAPAVSNRCQKKKKKKSEEEEG